MAYLNKAVEVEPDNVDAQLQLLLNTHEDKPAAQLPALKKLLEAEETKLKNIGVFQESMGLSGSISRSDRICGSIIPISRR